MKNKLLLFDNARSHIANKVLESIKISGQTEMRFVWMFEFGTEIGSSIAAIVSKLLKDSQIQSFRMCARLRICKCLRSKILVVVKMHCVCRYWSALACVRSCRIVFSWGIVPSNCY